MVWKSTVILVLTVPCFSRQPPSYEDIYPADITGKLKKWTAQKLTAIFKLEN